MTLSTTQRVAVVTGAGRGIGAAIAQGLAADGVWVALLARTASEIARVAHHIRASGGRAESLPADVTREDQIKAAIAAARERLGPIDILVNNAGAVAVQPLHEMSRQGWDAVISTNLTSAFLCCREVVPSMLRRRWGRIINIASISGRLGTPDLTAYCASKWGVLGLSKALAEEVKSSTVTVNAVCPGSVDTDMLKQSRPNDAPLMTPEDIADAVRFLASDRAKRITGAVLDIFGTHAL